MELDHSFAGVVPICWIAPLFARACQRWVLGVCCGFGFIFKLFANDLNPQNHPPFSPHHIRGRMAHGTPLRHSLRDSSSLWGCQVCSQRSLWFGATTGEDQDSTRHDKAALKDGKFRRQPASDFSWNFKLNSSCWKNSLGKCSSNPLIQYLYHMFSSISLPLTNLWQLVGSTRPAVNATRDLMRCTEIISERGLKAAELSNRPSPRFWRSRLPD